MSSRPDSLIHTLFHYLPALPPRPPTTPIAVKIIAFYPGVLGQGPNWVTASHRQQSVLSTSKMNQVVTIVIAQNNTHF